MPFAYTALAFQGAFSEQGHIGHVAAPVLLEEVIDARGEDMLLQWLEQKTADARIALHEVMEL